MRQTTIGIDVAKDNLDAYRRPAGDARRFPNTNAGRQALIRWIGGDVARVVFEPTGRYGKPLERALHAADLPAIKVNPWQARRYAEAAGQRAKTDPIDAAMLAEMGDALQLAPQPKPCEAVEILKELAVARLALVKDRTAAKNRQKQLTAPLLRRQNAMRLRQIERDLKAVDDAIKAVIADHPELARRAHILESIPGLGPATAAALIAEMPELGTIDAKAAAALAGLAPMTRQSGRTQRRARIQGGRAQLRQALYMPALVAARYNSDLKRVYERLVNAGKPKKLAVTAIMRKLIVLANALIAQDRKWAESPP